MNVIMLRYCVHIINTELILRKRCHT